ncbi:MAG: RDD family protein [Pseudomonadales bacterium]|nr:RDD family protein [Pseudomonadales bacterium]
MNIASPEPASLWRRLAAMLYDGFLIIALWFISSIILVALNNGEAITGRAFQLFLYFEAGAFYTYFWHFKGQTLGMQVWKIRTINDTGEILTLGECAVRFFFATFSLVMMGLGFIWILFDPDRLAWHDRASGTRVIYLGKDAYTKVSDEAGD